jgi:N-terminal domain of anti-restriction factor ArdC
VNNMTQQQLQTLAHWGGSDKTAEIVREEIAARWGEEEAENYDPLKNCFTLVTWNKLGYKVKRGEKAIRSVTYVADKKQQQGKEAETNGEGEPKVRLYPKTVYLFYRLQVERR